MLASLSNLSIRLRMRAVFALLALQLTLGGALGIASLAAAHERWDALYRQRAQLSGALLAQAREDGRAAPALAAGVDALGPAEYDAAGRDYRRLAWSYAAGTVLGVLLVALAGAWLVRAACTPLAAAVRIARTVAAGDLTQHIAAGSRDEAGQLMAALAEMNARLRQIVGEVLAETEGIVEVAATIAAGHDALSARTAQQAGSLERTAAALATLTASVGQAGDGVTRARTLALSASAAAGDGGAAVSQVALTMGALNASARKITGFIGLIDAIAFQTNILALNAAVEAARAGASGAGFAVVAAEVRQLAQRSTAAAAEIRGLIGDSVARIGGADALAGQAGATMDQLLGSVGAVSAIMAELGEASVAQRGGIDAVNQAVVQIGGLTERNAALGRQAALSADQLRGRAAGLQAAASRFRLG